MHALTSAELNLEMPEGDAVAQLHGGNLRQAQQQPAPQPAELHQLVTKEAHAVALQLAADEGAQEIRAEGVQPEMMRPLPDLPLSDDFDYSGFNYEQELDTSPGDEF
ncbi:uncharacterized protein LOC117174324 [Belonocnema kinseyi]|uniref:uncharacterized protein LOC117174324 n=1 Tax=Belonocnema kinseyi TaxID=2817044 RepID=UPI00143D3DA9|nr:uncharacterized protein LOC117174324 [Belonocnema kinseyi]XP_033219243.1 uncharacterized protein LOC117174324 [Belonocnema kinseyi]XP_033219252.1 uncharacterized protein LOC117174324 [Belonocnema kinseyi]XP_033219260.1 uncharacterized protein LOC117174324 [Belonocnema kinseyi]XP_033219269.1 uncharacterized protein LOC117174324 [Belonocnema kinseyi]XP_033219277.1 uncharacterized protein LOC117174324 [Belonocnema kinseyi]